MEKVDGLTPFVKWAGGKRQLIEQLKMYIPSSYDTYYEPFIGGGALFLNLMPSKAMISDLNEELINTWQVIKKYPHELLEQLSYHQKHNSKEHYLYVRGVDRDGTINKMSPTARAARFIYLNKAGFNGLWRVNKKGQHNVPFSNPKNLNLIMTEKIMEISSYLNRNDISIQHQSYHEAIQNIKAGDFVYFDPPYIPLTKTSAFTSYTKEDFNIDDQIQLRDISKELAQNGVYVMLSNSSSELVYELYSDDIFHIHEVEAKRSINSKGNHRGAIKEVIITTY